MLTGMGMRARIATSAGQRVTPSLAAGSVRAALDRAIDGIGPLRSAADAATTRLVDADGDVETAARALVRHHTGLAGAQGFVTNLGGFASLAVAVPANVAGVTLVQCHLVAGIAHLRGYVLDDPRVRNAILACMLGEESVEELVRRRVLPVAPMALATSPAHSPALDEVIATELTTELLARTAGRRAVTLVGRRIPLLGGAVGGGSDALATWQIGHYTLQELRDRNVRR